MTPRTRAVALVILGTGLAAVNAVAWGLRGVSAYGLLLCLPGVGHLALEHERAAALTLRVGLLLAYAGAVYAVTGRAYFGLSALLLGFAVAEADRRGETAVTGV